MISTSEAVVEVIDRLLDDIDGELTSKSRIVDGLLDLRLAGATDEATVAFVDATIVDIPGLTTAENAWWMEKLSELRGMVASQPELAGLAD